VQGPYFSIVVPVYNRERQVARCLTSILSQSFGDLELIVVDDGSRDASLARVQEIADPRLRIVRHADNLGVGPARSSGIDAARAEWLIFLDSDDELVPGALELIHRLAGEAPGDLGALCFRCRRDNGELSPQPLPAPIELDYPGYIAFLERVRGQHGDMLRCVRRRCFDHVRYPLDRMLEDKFHLDFARRFRLRIHLDVARLYHQDSDNSLVRYLLHLDPVRDRAFVRDRANGFRALLAEHGREVARIAPGLYGDYLQQAATSAIYARRRGQALGYAVCLVARSPMRPRSWMILAASLAGAAATARLRDASRRWCRG
jgi:glycosyltransferase involved in cell wall biosynthesis